MTDQVDVAAVMAYIRRTGEYRSCCRECDENKECKSCFGPQILALCTGVLALREENAKLKEEADELQHSNWEYMDLNEYLRDKVRGLRSYISQELEEKLLDKT